MLRRGGREERGAELAAAAASALGGGSRAGGVVACRAVTSGGLRSVPTASPVAVSSSEVCRDRLASLSRGIRRVGMPLWRAST